MKTIFMKNSFLMNYSVVVGCYSSLLLTLMNRNNLLGRVVRNRNCFINLAAAAKNSTFSAADNSAEEKAETAVLPAKKEKNQQTNYVIKRAKLEVDCEYANLSQEQLISELKRFKAYSVQLKSLLKQTVKQNKQNEEKHHEEETDTEANDEAAAATTVDTNDDVESTTKKKKKRRLTSEQQQLFDFNRTNKRHILLKFAYLGWNYHGFQSQEGKSNTVESYLFDALTTTKLIESRMASNYRLCGRTDKGVSAFSQVVSIDVRSMCSSGRGVIQLPDSNVTNEDIKNELNYPKLLNSCLPKDIKVIAWSPTEPEFSARFDCAGRIYRYYFPKGDLDIELMRDAANRLIGERDFRNFCKMDISNGILTFKKRISNVRLNFLTQNDEKSTADKIYSMVELIVEGKSFLWHQIRCIVAVLFLVGQKKEPPSIIDDLLDIEKYPCKPLYAISSELPLVLFDCHYENVDWIYDQDELGKLVKHFQDLWTDNQTKAVIIKRMLDHIEMDSSVSSSLINLNQPYAALNGGELASSSKNRKYVCFRERQTSLSLEEKIKNMIQKGKLDPNVYKKLNK